jgi:hypothetical protein
MFGQLYQVKLKHNMFFCDYFSGRLNLGKYLHNKYQTDTLSFLILSVIILYIFPID